MIERCYSCMGKKTIIGLGALIKDCPVCDGVGYVTIEDKIKAEIAVVNEVIADSGFKFKRVGRPKKVNNEKDGPSLKILP